jgi:hypothetical protein
MALRDAPRSVELGKRWPDGTEMDGLGAEQDVAGWTWSRVRDPDGNDGWVPTNYLVPNDDGESPPVVAPGLSAPSAPPTLIIVPTLAPPTPAPTSTSDEPAADRPTPNPTAWPATAQQPGAATASWAVTTSR